MRVWAQPWSARPSAVGNDSQLRNAIVGISINADNQIGLRGGQSKSGIKRDGDRLSIRAIEMDECSNPGGVFHRSGIAEFPKSFQQRIEAYLASLPR